MIREIRHDRAALSAGEFEAHRREFVGGGDGRVFQETVQLFLGEGGGLVRFQQRAVQTRDDRGIEQRLRPRGGWRELDVRANLTPQIGGDPLCHRAGT